MFRKLSKLYPILSVVLIVFSIIGAVLLVRQNQNPERKAECPCNSCSGAHPVGPDPNCNCVNTSGQEPTNVGRNCSGGTGTDKCGGKGNCGAGTVCVGDSICNPGGSSGNGHKYKCQSQDNFVDLGVDASCSVNTPVPSQPPASDPGNKDESFCAADSRGKTCTKICCWTGGSGCVEEQINGTDIKCNVSGGTGSCAGGDKTVYNQGYCTTTGQSPVPNPSASAWQCQVCTCSFLTNGECRSNCVMMACSSVSAPACGQVDACPPGQSTTQCGAAQENRRVYDGGCGSTPGPTKPASTNTPKPSNTSTPTPKNTSTPIPSPVPNSCGYHPCDASNPCNAGLTCVLASTGISFCTMPLYSTACVANPSSATCCNPPAPTNTPGPSATPTPGPTSTPGPGPTSTPGPNPTVTSSPVAGNPTRIVLPAAGFDFPVKGLTVVGTIISLLGLLVLL